MANEYNNIPPMPNKYLLPDGSIVTFDGAEYAPPDIGRVQEYRRKQVQVAKWLMPDGSIVAGIPMDMTPFEALFVPKTTEINGHPLSGDITLTPEDIGLPDALIYKGTIDCSSNPNYPAADAGHYYKVSADGKIGGASGHDVKTGDALICNTDGTPAGTEAAVGTKWDKLQGDINIPQKGTAENDFLMSGAAPNYAWLNKTKEQATAVLEALLLHNNVQSKQGGTTNQFYHLTKALYDALVANGVIVAPTEENAVLVASGSPLGWTEISLTNFIEAIEALLLHNNVQGLQGGEGEDFYHVLPPEEDLDVLVASGSPLAWTKYSKIEFEQAFGIGSYEGEWV